MSAAPALAPIEAWFPSNASNREWAVLSGRAPQLVATMRRYLLQLTTFLAARSVEVADTTLRQLARWLTTDTEVAVVNEITRGHVEDYKVWDVTRSCLHGRRQPFETGGAQFGPQLARPVGVAREPPRGTGAAPTRSAWRSCPSRASHPACRPGGANAS
jgi:hypothetical protein